MRKLNQSVAVQRQIPEYIKTNYPYFVEFVKAYYEFLQQTQQRNLEGYRDIDTTLDEFVTRFKSELSENVPVALSKDKRTLLRNIREFYLSRGSEASFKFLFKVLFEKEATLFYPSTQILRASDGRWIQENSIFVKVVNPNQTLFPLIGKFVTVNTGTRVLEIYVSNVVEYKSDVYELSILNTESNQFIGVGNTVIYYDGATKYVSNVLKSPVKLSVYKKGKGFKLGDIFSLKTDLGDGCLIKVTSVDSDGGIKGVSLIKFGLDYETKFWSYLVPGQLQGLEYIQPTTLWENGTILDSRKITSSTKELISGGTNAGKYRVTIFVLANHNLQTGGKITITTTSGPSQINGTFVVESVPTTNTFTYVMSGGTSYTSTITEGYITKPYEESSKGFIEYGYASKQTYLEYDASIPVANDLGRDADRYYVDGSYVGDIVNQFYNEQTAQDPTADYAIVQVDIGAVAKYPGYYSASNGFISDECFIQDGYYYQTYSYVIRVEEEFKKYADLVKNVLHPTGMKLFAEYDIFNNIDLSFLEESSKRTLQFSDSVSNIIDRGYNYTAYDNQILFTGPGSVTTLNTDGIEQTKPLTIQVIPVNGAPISNSPVGDAALFPYKPFYDYYGFTQIVGKTASLQEVVDRNAQLVIDPTLQFPGHDVLEKYHLEKNTNLTYSSGISESDITVIDGGFGYINGSTYTLTFSDPTLSSGVRAEGYAIWTGDIEGNGTWAITITNSGSGYILDSDNSPNVTITVQSPPGTTNVFTAIFEVTALSNLANGIPSTFVNSSDLIFGNNTNIITSTTIDLSIFKPDYQVTIYGARNFSNNGTFTVSSSSSNQLIILEKNFIYEDVAVADPVYSVIIRVTNAPFNDFETPSSSGYGYTSYSTTLDSLGNPLATPLNSLGVAVSGSPLSNPSTALVSYTRSVTNQVYSGNRLWSSPEIDIYNTPTNYQSHSAYYMSINSALRSQITVTSYVSTGGTSIVAAVNNSSGFFAVGDIIRIRNASGAQQSNLNGTWIITSTSSTTITFEIESIISTGIYSSNIGQAFTWRPNQYFTQYSDPVSSGYGYDSHVTSIDSIGNTSSTPAGAANKVYTRSTSSLQDSSLQNYTQVSTSVTPYASHSAYHAHMNSYPRQTLAVTSYTTNGTTTVTASVSSTASLSVGDKIRITGITGATTEVKRNLLGTWTISEIVNSISFRFVIYSSMSTATHTSNIGTAVTWRPNPYLTDGQQLESTGYSYTAYDDSVGTNVTQEIAYSGTVETDTGIKNVNVYVSTAGSVGSQRVYSGGATSTILTDSSGQTYRQITGNTSDTSVLPHLAQRLNKVKVDSVSNTEDGRVVLNAYNEEASWQNGYYSESQINVNHYEAHNSIPFDGNTYVFVNKPS